jgi:hypothetical protein
LLLRFSQLTQQGFFKANGGRGGFAHDGVLSVQQPHLLDTAGFGA